MLCGPYINVRSFRIGKSGVFSGPQTTANISISIFDNFLVSFRYLLSNTIGFISPLFVVSHIVMRRPVLLASVVFSRFDLLEYFLSMYLKVDYNLVITLRMFQFSQETLSTKKTIILQIHTFYVMYKEPLLRKDKSSSSLFAIKR